MMKPYITADHLREMMDYVPLTGTFTWKGPRKGSKLSGEAGTLDKDGYVVICINYRQYKAHRLAWLYVHGQWPVNEIDHKDTIRHHNWIDNLREATSTQNKANFHRRTDNTSGVKGVSWDKTRRKWIAKICVGKKHKNLGRYDTIEEAADAYRIAAESRFGEFARPVTEGTLSS